MYSFQNATNEMKAWLPNDFLMLFIDGFKSLVLVIKARLDDVIYIDFSRFADVTIMVVRSKIYVANEVAKKCVGTHTYHPLSVEPTRLRGTRLGFWWLWTEL
jgi:hypothetical protein